MLRVAVNQRLFFIEEWRTHAMIKQTRIERAVRIAWGSSPWALRDVLRKVDQDAYRSQMEAVLTTRQAAVAPVLAALATLRWEDDAKLMRLRNLLAELHAKGEQVIIFSEQQATVVYLDHALQQLLPHLRVASLVRWLGEGRYEVLGVKQATAKIAAFAPRANNRSGEAQYDVLLATDAYGVGVNIQDARVVINYDLAWTPIEPAQRAGRVLRFRHTPATVQLITFYAASDPTVSYGPRALGIIRRQTTLQTRDRSAATLLNLAMMPTATNETVDVAAHAPPQEGVLVFMLLQHRGIIALVLYDLASQRLRATRTETEILDVIACEPDTATAAIDPGIVEAAGDACLRAWCVAQEYSVHEVVRLATLYLQPHSQEHTIEEWLRIAVQKADEN